ncbi:MAG TPA: polysaccharide ABC transporter ATP-binding protein [Methylomirabilota bacterium]|nr:polysaccharide ABC transporter ATP-binding protein [Methylomirabilota bacterium]
MAEPIISVRSLGKRYLLGARQHGSRGFRHLLEDALKAPARWARGLGARRDDGATGETDFWALRDVSFEVQRGEVVGIIGRNGAGKSTLLKILSRITEPTTGEIHLRGRVASLLEVGTGFHPELTGRENIFLNGAILGMKRAEIRRKFDEIVAFAEVEKFIDTPVKRYSSGMYVRLAFAVAAHLDPEILIVDEVLAVGDATFQQKCLGKMRDVSRSEGRTVLFVSHQLSAISQLCRKGICLRGGQIEAMGSIDETIRAYLATAQERDGHWVYRGFEELRKRKRLFFREVSVSQSPAGVGSTIDVRHPFTVEVVYEVVEPLSDIELALRILTSDGRAVFTSLHSEADPSAPSETRRGMYRATITVPGMLLMPGGYFINIAAHRPAGELFDVQEGVVPFTVNDTGTVYSRYGNYSSIGVVMPRLAWAHAAVREGAK